MEREVFEDDACAQALNSNFISIKIDREERPDIDNIYMEACQSLTGSGGWPLSVFITPDKLPFFAGTYMPKDRFLSVISQLKNIWDSDRTRITAAADTVTSNLEHRTFSGGFMLSEETAHAAYNSFRLRFDPEHGGFGGAPKFPGAHSLMFLIRYGLRYNKPEALNMAKYTMEAMSRGGIYDHIGGGFCRYSTDKYFLAPHFEKMLYDNAMLSLLYAENGYFDVTRGILGYCINEMRDSRGGFYTAQDADSEGVEGKFYVFTPKEIYSVLGKEDGIRFCEMYDITERGNFETGSIPNLLRYGSLSPEDETFAAPCRKKLYAYRASRIPPLKDDKILVSSNGLMIAALATAGRMLHDAEYIKYAKNAAEFILGNLMHEGRLYSVWRGTRLPHKAILDDYAYLAWGLFRLHQATLDDFWLNMSRSLIADTERLFSSKDGVYYISGNDVYDLPVRGVNGFDGALPSGNGIISGILLRLWQLTGEQVYLERYHKLTDAFASDAKQYPTAFCSLLSSFMLLEHGGFKVEFPPGDTEFRKILSEFKPFAVWKTGDINSGARVCYDGACRPPVNTAKELSDILSQ